MNFIDLFAGLGGFHLALRQLGHTCVFASEIDSTLRGIYKKNFNLDPAGDICDVAVADIPHHDILCAGFPCQPFSKAGYQQGFADRRGTLFDHVLRIVEYHEPTYVILENVPNLERHDGGKTWQALTSRLGEAGYDVDSHRLSPHQFGIPQIRDRLFIVGSRRGLGFTGFPWPDPHAAHAQMSITNILDSNPSDARRLSQQVVRCIDVWQEFLDLFPSEMKLPSFPIWSMEFGATYPFEDTTPFAVGLKDLRKYRGSHGRPLTSISDEHLLQALPSHARAPQDTFPRWKVQFIRQNRDLYRTHRSWIDPWMTKILEFPSSFQKLEWNCQGGERDIWKYVLQCRPSGVRVKRPTTAPSLVALNATQVPIIAWERRYLTPRECARLQSMHKLVSLPDTPTKAFEALGNAVNVELVRMIAAQLLSDHESMKALEAVAAS